MEWVSIKDRLPENKSEVLTIVKYMPVAIQAYFHHDKWFASYYVTQTMKDVLVKDREMQSQSITHWMQLPEPPKQ